MTSACEYLNNWPKGLNNLISNAIPWLKPGAIHNTGMSQGHFRGPAKAVDKVKAIFQPIPQLTLQLNPTVGSTGS